MSGYFVTFEGIDGTGKSTQIACLIQHLEEQGIPYRLLREPGGTAVGEGIRQILLDHKHQNMTDYTELLLFIAARCQLVDEVIRPALAAGELVICDRFMDSTIAYQGYGRGLPAREIENLNRLAIGHCLPDRTFLLTLPPAESQHRLQTSRATKQDRLDQAGLAFMAGVAAGYQQLAAAEPSRICVIDAHQSIEQVATQIWRQVQMDLRDK